MHWTTYSAREVDRFCLGLTTYLLVNASDLQPPGHVSRLELINLYGNLLADLPVTTERSRDDKALYNSSAFFPPDEFFYIQVITIIIIIIFVITMIIDQNP